MELYVKPISKVISGWVLILLIAELIKNRFHREHYPFYEISFGGLIAGVLCQTYIYGYIRKGTDSFKY